MKVRRVYYNDDDILIAGHLIERRFKRPVFYPFEAKCGFDSEVIRDKSLIIEYTKEAYRKFYKATYPKGAMILLIEMKNDPRPIPRGTAGIVDYVDDAPTIHCKFDNGRYLGVIPGVDVFRKMQ